MGCLLPSLVTSQSMVMIGNKSLVCAQSNVTNKIVFNFMIGGGLDAANDVVYNKMIELAVIFYILFSLLYSKYRWVLKEFKWDIFFIREGQERKSE